VIVDIAIVFTIVGYVAYVVLITRAGTVRKKKNALANLARLYERHRSRK
jgi:hypothetical protein